MKEEMLPKMQVNITVAPEALSTFNPRVNTIAHGSFAIVFGLAIIITSAVPAAAIWRTADFHKPSYYYLMVLCLIDTAVGFNVLCYSIVILLLYVTVGGISVGACSMFELFMVFCMTANNLLMVLLSRDRCISVQKPLEYLMMVSKSTVWRHAGIVAGYGLLQTAIFALGRYFGGLSSNVHPHCRADNWILQPENWMVAVTFVLGNLQLDVCTAVYNMRTLFSAWKVSMNARCVAIWVVFI